MTAPVKRWLAQQLEAIDSVQKATISTVPDIVVHSWSGVLVHVHIVDEPIKPRTLKRQVQESTRVGIGSLYVVNAALLPADGACTMPADWLMMLHALTDEKVYAYRVTADGPRIQQVHFQMTTKSDERDIWYGPDIVIGQLPFFRVWLKTPLLKGDFLVANFGAPAFWHNRDYRQARQQAADDARRANRTYTRAEYGVGGARTHGNLQRPTELEVYLGYLGLKRGATCDEIKSAFRRRALEIHPDVSSLPKQEAEQRFRELNDAYNYIRSAIDCA